MKFVTELCSVTKLGTLLDQLTRQIYNQAVTAHVQSHSGCILLHITAVFCTVCLSKVVHRNTYIHNTFYIMKDEDDDNNNNYHSYK